MVKNSPSIIQKKYGLQYFDHALISSLFFGTVIPWSIFAFLINNLWICALSSLMVIFFINPYKNHYGSYFTIIISTCTGIILGLINVIILYYSIFLLEGIGFIVFGISIAISYGLIWLLKDTEKSKIIRKFFLVIIGIILTIGTIVFFLLSYSWDWIFIPIFIIVITLGWIIIRNNVFWIHQYLLMGEIPPRDKVFPIIENHLLTASKSIVLTGFTKVKYSLQNFHKSPNRIFIVLIIISISYLVTLFLIPQKYLRIQLLENIGILLSILLLIIGIASIKRIWMRILYIFIILGIFYTIFLEIIVGSPSACPDGYCLLIFITIYPLIHIVSLILGIFTMGIYQKNGNIHKLIILLVYMILIIGGYKLIPNILSWAFRVYLGY